MVFNGDVLTQVDLGAVLRLHRERKAKATIVLTPVDNPRAYGLVETDANGNVSRFLEKPGEDEITCNTINAGIYVLEPDTFDRIPKDTAWSIERSFFPSLIERGETFVAYVYDGYWIDIGTPAKYMQVHRDIMDGRYQAPPFTGSAASMAWVVPGRQGRGRRGTARALLRRRGRGGEGRGAHPSLLRHRPPDARRRRGGHRRIDHLAERMDWPRRGRPRVGPRPQLPHRPKRHHRNARPARRQDRRHRLQPLMTHQHASIFKAYDVRGLYPAEVNEDAARQIGRGFVAYLERERIAVSRDMRLSSPAVAAAFIEGAREQGADVVDYGMLATDMMYFARRARWARRRRADYRVAQSEAVQRHQAGAARGVSAQRRGGPRRDPRHDRGRHAAAAGGDAGHRSRRWTSWTTTSSTSCRSSIRRSSSRSTSCSTPAAAWRAWSRRSSSSVCRAGRRRSASRSTARFPNHEANPLIEENRRDIVERVIASKADIGIAWDGDADRCFFIDGTGEFIAGDFVTALLAEAFLLQAPGRQGRLRRPRELRGQGHGRDSTAARR